jgi:hypothetical protein
LALRVLKRSQKPFAGSGEQWRDGRLQFSLDVDWLAQFNRNVLPAKLADEMKAVLS